MANWNILEEPSGQQDFLSSGTAENVFEFPVAIDELKLNHYTV